MISADGIAKLYSGGNGGVRGIDLDVKAGEFFTLLGPSGCGKTTTMRMIAGLVRPDAGDIALAGRPVSSAGAGLFVPPAKRGIGMVFQSYAIWPHLSVAQNVAYPLRVRKMRKAAIRAKVMTALEMVDLAEMADRPSPLLSGGQQQRVALARALVAEPSVLLLDEPLSNLDAALRQRMRGWLKDLQRELGVTTLYVTHDQQEALAMSDRIAVMRDGRVVQAGDPLEVYLRPRNRFAAEFTGTTNLVECGIAGGAAPAGVAEVDAGFGRPVRAWAGDAVRGDKALLSIRPEAIELVADGNVSDQDVFAGQVVHRTLLGNVTEYVVRIGTQQLRVSAGTSDAPDLDATVTLRLRAERCMLLPHDDPEAATSDPATEPALTGDAR